MLHNQTSRKQVDKVYPHLFKKYPSAKEMSRADTSILSNILKPLGLYNRRARSLIKMSEQFYENRWKKPTDLYGCGKYAEDCYRVFCTGEWKDVTPTDHALNDYVDWLNKEVDNARRT